MSNFASARAMRLTQRAGSCAAVRRACRKSWRRLQPLADDVLQQVRDAVAVTPFIIVPAHELEEPLVQLNAGALIEDRRGSAVDEVAGDDLVLRVFEDAFEIGLAGILHCGRDFGIAGVLGRLYGQIND